MEQCRKLITPEIREKIDAQYMGLDDPTRPENMAEEMTTADLKERFIELSYKIKSMELEMYSKEDVIEFAKMALQNNSSKLLSTGFKWIEDNA
jgi:hypothetical protein